MYESIKHTLKRIIPEETLFRFEEPLRFFHSIAYWGSNHKCNVCETSLKSFIQLTNSELLCPKCGSIGRNRRLFQLLHSQYFNNGIKVLHFSPPRSLYRRFKKNQKINYTSTDYLDEFIADKKLDITNIDEPDNQYDLIICYHVLEHIENDTKAMSELFRITQKDGTCLIQTPFKDGEIYEDYSIISPEERLIHFGQEDHVRFYSANGLKDRLINVGFKVEIMNFNDPQDNAHGFNSNETIIKAIKP